MLQRAVAYHLIQPFLFGYICKYIYIYIYWHIYIFITILYLYIIFYEKKLIDFSSVYRLKATYLYRIVIFHHHKNIQSYFTEGGKQQTGPSLSPQHQLKIRWFSKEDLIKAALAKADWMREGHAKGHVNHPSVVQLLFAWCNECLVYEWGMFLKRSLS